MGNVSDCGEPPSTPQFFEAYGFYSIYRQYGPFTAVIKRSIPKSKTQKLTHSSIFSKKLRVLLKENNIVPLKEFRFEEQDYSYDLVLVYPLFEGTLAQRRREMKEGFGEEEIIRVIEDVGRALRSLDQNGYRHNQLNLDTILHDQGRYYLTDIGSTKGLNSYEQALKGSTSQHIILSPSLLSQVKARCLLARHTIHDDLFSLGLICLTLMTSQSSSIFYDWNQKVMRDGVVDNQLMMAGKKYSSIVIRKVKELLNEGRRSESETMGSSRKREGNQNFIEGIKLDKLREEGREREN